MNIKRHPIAIAGNLFREHLRSVYAKLRGENGLSLNRAALRSGLIRVLGAHAPTRAALCALAKGLRSPQTMHLGRHSTEVREGANFSTRGGDVRSKILDIRCIKLKRIIEPRMSTNRH